MSVTIDIQMTPNPNALKFLLSENVIEQGKMSFATPVEAESIPMIAELFKLRGVDQIHLFENVITVTKFSFEPWEKLEHLITETIRSEIKDHQSDLSDFQPKVADREHLSPEMQQIESILDLKIRPGLQGDGGDLVCIDFSDNVLLIKYEGACGTCPSSTMGTLEAIRAILKDDYHPEIEVYIAPVE
jgi:Fe-S cluster biogenesis protein NfuA